MRANQISAFKNRLKGLEIRPRGKDFEVCMYEDVTICMEKQHDLDRNSSM